jgi:hypothetical protein
VVCRGEALVLFTSTRYAPLIFRCTNYLLCTALFSLPWSREPADIDHLNTARRRVVMSGSNFCSHPCRPRSYVRIPRLNFCSYLCSLIVSPILSLATTTTSLRNSWLLSSGICAMFPTRASIFLPFFLCGVVVAVVSVVAVGCAVAAKPSAQTAL